MRDLYNLAEELDSENEIAAAGARRNLRNSLLAIEPAFSQLPYFMSEEYTLVDCCMAPLLWRLEAYGIRLPASVRALRRYAESLFERDAFQSSMSEPGTRDVQAHDGLIQPAFLTRGCGLAAFLFRLRFLLVRLSERFPVLEQFYHFLYTPGAPGNFRLLCRLPLW